MRTTYGMVLVNNYNQILVGHPTYHRASHWSIPKGQKDNTSESNLDTVMREFLEETSINIEEVCRTIIDVSDLLNKRYKYQNNNKELYGFFGLVDYIRIEDFICKSMVKNSEGIDLFPEMDAFAWLGVEELFLLNKNQNELIKDIREIIHIF